MGIEQNDHLRKYYIFNVVLALWIAFIPLKNAIYQGSVFLMIILFTFHIIRFKKFVVVKEVLQENKTIFTAFLFIFVSMVLSSLLGINTQDSLSESFKFLIRYVLVFLILLYFYHQNFFTQRFVFLTILFSLSIYGLDGLYQYFTGYDFFKNIPIQGDGLTAVMHNRNLFGFIMALGAVISFSMLLYYKTEKKLEKYLLLFIFFLMIFNLFFSMSRASWSLFTIYVVLVVLYGTYKKQLSSKALLLIFALIVSIAFLFYLNQNLLTRFYSLLDGNSSGRFEIWESALPFIFDNLLFGYGIDTFNMLITQKYAGMHNVVLEILLFLGVFGLFAYIYFFYSIFKRLLIIKKYLLGFFLISFLFLLQFDGSLVYSKLNLSVLVVALFFIYATNQENKKRGK